MTTQAPPSPLLTAISHAGTSLVNLSRQLGDDAGLLEYAPSHLTEWMDHDYGNNITKRKVKISTVPSTTATTAPLVVVWASMISDRVIFETLADDGVWNTIDVAAVVASSNEWEIPFMMDDPPRPASHSNILRALVKFYTLKEDIALPKPFATFSNTFITHIVSACRRFKSPDTKSQARKNIKKQKERYLAMLQEHAADAASGSLVTTGSLDMTPQARASHEYAINQRLNFPELRTPETTNIGSSPVADREAELMSDNLSQHGTGHKYITPTAAESETSEGRLCANNLETDETSTVRQHVLESHEQENILNSVLETKIPTFGSTTIDWDSYHEYDLQSGRSAEDYETIIQEMVDAIGKYNSEIKDEHDALNNHRMNAMFNIKRIHQLRMVCMETKGVYESKLKLARTAASIVSAPKIHQTSDSQGSSSHMLKHYHVFTHRDAKFQANQDPQQKADILDDAIKDFDAAIEVDEDMLKQLQERLREGSIYQPTQIQILLALFLSQETIQNALLISENTAQVVISFLRVEFAAKDQFLLLPDHLHRTVHTFGPMPQLKRDLRLVKMEMPKFKSPIATVQSRFPR
ncbi:hypothetical protein K505DRAFT_386694 [Melanomma pulvis-pyrius CBS 109.77]|uniref:Uncharacterized protein n=1 Tax=Melanomma pulvis-pyrius CBS 109.77 TaxID=1314802 RepID=A0A6A6X8Y1_9PLEO|nr:hypothetical protein K505DRAFT_386694 [Melanomma pulvis-pyrius CBS 109.77]